jgi:hypothetical protein
MKILNFDDVIAGVSPIVAATPDFVYPNQENVDDERCQCVELLADPDDMDDENPEEFYDYSACSWHMDDDNTCRYVKPNGEAACVLGKYFISMGFEDLHLYEKRAPSFILDRNGYEVTDKANKFLNTIQQQQDQGWSWEEAYMQAVEASEGVLNVS